MPSLSFIKVQYVLHYRPLSITYQNSRLRGSPTWLGQGWLGCRLPIKHTACLPTPSQMCWLLACPCMTQLSHLLLRRKQSSSPNCEPIKEDHPCNYAGHLHQEFPLADLFIPQHSMMWGPANKLRHESTVENNAVNDDINTGSDSYMVWSRTLTRSP